MVKDKVEDILNVGIPTYGNIELNVTNLTNKAHVNYTNAINAERHMFDEANKRVQNVTNISKEDKLNNVLNRILFHSDISNSKSNIYIDNNEKKTNLYRDLIDLSNNEPNIDNKIIIRLEEYDNVCDYVRNNSYTTQMHNYLKENYNKIYYARKYGADLRSHLNNVRSYYHELKANEDKIDNIDLSDLINEYLEYLDVDKLVNQILLSDLSMTEVSLENNDINNAIQYFFLVTAFMHEYNVNPNSDVYKEYYRLINTYPSLKTLYMNRELFINNSYDDNIKVIDNLLKVKKYVTTESFVKPGKNYDNNGNGSSRKRRPVTDEDKKVINDYLSEKLYTYLRYNPILQIETISNLKNYIGFLYENGIILTDRMYNVKSLSELKKDAIYVFNSSNFENLIKFDKQDLIGNVPRIMHKNNWQDKVIKYINEDTNHIYDKDTNDLILKRSI